MPRQRAADTPEPEIPFEQSILRLENWPDMPIAADEQGHVYWPVRALCAFLGVTPQAQLRQLRKHQTLHKRLRYFKVKTATRGAQEMWTIDQRYIGYWFGMIDGERVRPEIADKLIEFQEDIAAYANFRLFGGGNLPNLDNMNAEQLRTMLRQILSDQTMLKLVVRNMESRLGKVEGKLELLSMTIEEDEE